ncbi:MAG: PEP-CTERM sorting domain-containing protein [Burkholderiales bacterium]|nr:PEP-CTERM sorting domain-containing protein [Burkholderiales bacterium]
MPHPATLLPAPARADQAARLLGLAALLLVGPWAGTAQAARLSVGASVCEISAFGQNCSSDSLDTANGASGPELGASAGLFASDAHAIQGWGVFHGSARVNYQTSVGQSDEGAGMRASAGGMSEEYWTLGGHTGKGYLSMIWSISGTTVTSGSGPLYDTDASFTLEASSWFRPHWSGERNTGQATTHAITQAGMPSRVQMDGALPFYFDEPLLLTLRAGVTAGAGYSTGYAGPSYSGYAEADFSHTAVLTGITVMDEQGNILDDITIAAESGTRYPLTSAVPEPSAAALLAAGGIAMLVAGRRRPSGRGISGG